MAELFLQELGPDAIVRQTADFGLDSWLPFGIPGVASTRSEWKSKVQIKQFSYLLGLAEKHITSSRIQIPRYFCSLRMLSRTNYISHG